jgi:hypothetical protein
VSTSSKEPKALTKPQFGALLVVLAICGVAALVVLAGVAGKHGRCPSEGQTSRPSKNTCYAAYQYQQKTGVVGTPPKS